MRRLTLKRTSASLQRIFSHQHVVTVSDASSWHATTGLEESIDFVLKLMCDPVGKESLPGYPRPSVSETDASGSNSASADAAGIRPGSRPEPILPNASTELRSRPADSPRKETEGIISQGLDSEKSPQVPNGDQPPESTIRSRLGITQDPLSAAEQGLDRRNRT